MPGLTLRLVVDPATGRRELIVEMEREPDALPVEHEEAHRQLARALVGSVPLTRDREPAAEAPSAAEAKAEAERRGQKR